MGGTEPCLRTTSDCTAEAEKWVSIDEVDGSGNGTSKGAGEVGAGVAVGPCTKGRGDCGCRKSPPAVGGSKRKPGLSGGVGKFWACWEPP